MTNNFKDGTREVPSTESAGATRDKDKGIWDKLTSLIQGEGHSHQHILELWPSYVRRMHLGRVTAHYELFKNVIDLPGHSFKIFIRSF